MSLEYYTVENLDDHPETVVVKMPGKGTIKKEPENRDMSLEALIQTQIIQQDGK